MGVTIYAGNAGDRNERGMRGAVDLGTELARRPGVNPQAVGSPTALVEGGDGSPEHDGMPAAK
ncbi:hypothetical protein GCM10011611_65130 [Aliidongia dinghuensis]|uniref:Uncharacterized protein n=1 Tax=Aliidongia dinghuensis TaxID=1867774 RepID=A0A8J2Z104_9PROT|nr:hypothetical protein GCM10011611_65130 [Aliidongia dinghuensis]